MRGFDTSIICNDSKIRGCAVVSLGVELQPMKGVAYVSDLEIVGHKLGQTRQVRRLSFPGNEKTTSLEVRPPGFLSEFLQRNS